MNKIITFKDNTINTDDHKSKSQINMVKIHTDSENSIKKVNKSHTLVPDSASKINELITAQIAKKTDSENFMKNLTNIEEIKDFYEYTENCLKLMINCKKPDISEIRHQQKELPKYIVNDKSKKVAIFDLDETLIHSEIRNIKDGDVIISVLLPNGEYSKV